MNLIALMIPVIVMVVALPAMGQNAQEVSFKGYEGLELKGTLVIPKSAKPSPAVLLLPGSGPTDRNGNSGLGLVTDLYVQIAQELANGGIASLRFDKRAVRIYAASWPKDMDGLAHFFSWDAFAEDAAAAFKFLQSQPGVDPKRTGVVGHSEGGIIALDVVRLAKGRYREPAVLALLSTPARRLDVIIDEQLRMGLPKSGMPAEKIKSLLEASQRVSAECVRTGKVPKDTPAELAPLYPPYIGPYYRSVFGIIPSDRVKAYRGPVLVMNGAKDTQVSAERDARALDRALAARPGDRHKLAIIPNTSHNLKAVSGDLDPGFAGPVVPEALGTLREWLSKNL